MLHPTASVSQVNAFNQDIATVLQVDILGPGTAFVFEISSLAVNNAPSPDFRLRQLCFPLLSLLRLTPGFLEVDQVVP